MEPEFQLRETDNKKLNKLDSLLDSSKYDEEKQNRTGNRKYWAWQEGYKGETKKPQGQLQYIFPFKC